MRWLVLFVLFSCGDVPEEVTPSPCESGCPTGVSFDLPETNRQLCLCQDRGLFPDLTLVECVTACSEKGGLLYAVRVTQACICKEVK